MRLPLVLLCSLLTGVSVGAETVRLSPAEIRDWSGSHSGSVSALADAGESEVVVFSGDYDGSFVFRETSTLPDLSGFRLQVDFSGSPESEQRWTFEIYNFRQGRWVLLGDNGAAGEPARLVFPIGSESVDYLSESQEYEIRYHTAGPLTSTLDSVTLVLISDGYQTIQNYLQDDWKDPDFTPKSEHAARRYEIMTTGQGGSKLDAVKRVNPAIRSLRYVKMAGVRGPAGSGFHKSDESNALTPDHEEWFIWERVSAADIFWYADIDGDGDREVVTCPEENGYNGWAYIDIFDGSSRQTWIQILIDYFAHLLEELGSVRDEHGTVYIDPETQDEIARLDGFYIDNCMVPFPGYCDIEVEDDPVLAQQFYDACVEIIGGVTSAYPDLYFVLNCYNNRNETLDWKGIDCVEAGAQAMMRETLAIKRASKYYDRDRYIRALNDFVLVGLGTHPDHPNMGPKDLVQIDYAYTYELDRREYALASYLLYANHPSPFTGDSRTLGNAYFFIWSDDRQWYDIPDYPEHALDLGRPLETTFRVIEVNRDGERLQEWSPNQYLAAEPPSAEARLFLERNYEYGVVVTTPNITNDVPFVSDEPFERLRIEGGGMWVPEGDGTIEWTDQTNRVDLAPNQAMILRYQTPSDEPGQDAPPTVSIQSPRNGQVVSGAIEVVVEASDDQGVAAVELWLNGSPWITLVASPYVATLETSTLAPGSNHLLARATDFGGNEATDEVTFEVDANDQDAPTIQISSPTQGEEAANPVSIELTSTDVSSLKKIKVDVYAYDETKGRRASDPLSSLAASASGDVSYGQAAGFLTETLQVGIESGGRSIDFAIDWDSVAAGAGLGPFVLRVRSYDDAGFSTEREIGFSTVDSEPQDGPETPEEDTTAPEIEVAPLVDLEFQLSIEDDGELDRIRLDLYAYNEAKGRRESSVVAAPKPSESLEGLGVAEFESRLVVVRGDEPPAEGLFLDLTGVASGQYVLRVRAYDWAQPESNRAETEVLFRVD